MENKKIILVAEDDTSLLKVLNVKLSESGFNVLEAKDGEEGLKTSLDEHPDLILLDILMPKMDGIAMLKELRKDSWGKSVPVIILTNLTSHDDQRNKDIAELEPTYYFVKTDKTMEEIVEKIRERLSIPKE